jgi:hypothetical protein
VNRIEEAASLLENGWCIGNLRDPDDSDKHCAVGAMAVVTGHLVLIKDDETGKMIVDDHATYNNFNRLPEAKALAEEVMDSEWLINEPEPAQRMLGRYFNEGYYDEVVFSFNDSQSSADEVIEMFKYAAKRM